MAAERLRRRRAALLASLLWAASPAAAVPPSGDAAASGIDKPASGIDKPASGIAKTASGIDRPTSGIDKPATIAKRAPAPTHAWIDGTTRRPLTLDGTLQADFSPRGPGPKGVLRTAHGPLKDVSTALQSPVLRDETGRARALPGGVLLVLPGPPDLPDEAAARALLARHGAQAARTLAPGIWLLPAPAGLASLELANRLAATGAFVSAQPNWWVERTRK
jgi:hypothetical protein